MTLCALPLRCCVPLPASPICPKEDWLSVCKPPVALLCVDWIWVAFNIPSPPPPRFPPSYLQRNQGDIQAEFSPAAALDPVSSSEIYSPLRNALVIVCISVQRPRVLLHELIISGTFSLRPILSLLVHEALLVAGEGGTVHGNTLNHHHLLGGDTCQGPLKQFPQAPSLEIHT